MGLDATLLGLVALAEESCEKAVSYASMILSLRRRIRNALDLLEAGRTDEAKQMLAEALADDGGFMKRRLDKIVQAAWEPK